MGIIIAFLGKQLQKGHTYPTIIHAIIISNKENTVNSYEKNMKMFITIQHFACFIDNLLAVFVHYVEFKISYLTK